MNWKGLGRLAISLRVRRYGSLLDLAASLADSGTSLRHLDQACRPQNVSLPSQINRSSFPGIACRTLRISGVSYVSAIGADEHPELMYLGEETMWGQNSVSLPLHHTDTSQRINGRRLCSKPRRVVLRSLQRVAPLRDSRASSKYIPPQQSRCASSSSLPSLKDGTTTLKLLSGTVS